MHMAVAPQIMSDHAAECRALPPFPPKLLRPSEQVPGVAAAPDVRARTFPRVGLRCVWWQELDQRLQALEQWLCALARVPAAVSSVAALSWLEVEVRVRAQ